MANAPQNATRKAPTVTEAPPACAATPPRSARNTKDVPDTRWDQECDRGQEHDRQRHGCTDRKTGGRGQGGLDRPCTEGLGDPELVADMGTEPVMGHQAIRHLLRQGGLETAPDIDLLELVALAHRVRLQLPALQLDIGLFGIRLGVDRHILARRHGHGPSHQSGNPGDQNAAMGAIRCGDTQHEACGGHDAVVRPQHSGAQPADAVRTVPFQVTWTHSEAP